MVKANANHLTKSTVDWDILMSRTYSQCTDAEMETMMLLKDKVKADMREHGKTTFEFCDRIGVPKNEFDSNRDSNVLAKQDIQSLNHEATRSREADRKRLTMERTDPIFISERKKVIASENIILKELKRQDMAKKKEEARLRKSEEKDQLALFDKDGKIAFKNQKKMEAQAKKAEADRKKGLKNQARKQEYDDAKENLGPVRLNAVLQRHAVMVNQHDIIDSSADDEDSEEA